MADAAEKLLREAMDYYAADLATMPQQTRGGFTGTKQKALLDKIDRITAHLATPAQAAEVNGGWISVADKLPTVEDGDANGYVLAWHPVFGPSASPRHWARLALYGSDPQDKSMADAVWQRLPALPAALTPAASGTDERK